MIKNLVWDVDGTLFDTYPAITYALSKSLNQMGKPVALNLIDGLVRQSFQYCIDTLSKRYKVDGQALHNRFAQIYKTMPLQNQPLLNGARELCQWAVDQGGVNLAVLYRNGVDMQGFFAAYGVAPLFAGLQPDIVLDEGEGLCVLLAEYRLDPQDTLVIGDRLANIGCGKLAGCKTCLIGDEVMTAQADWRADDHTALLKMLQGLDG